jgi:hypothetical protein
MFLMEHVTDAGSKYPERPVAALEKLTPAEGEGLAAKGEAV